MENCYNSLVYRELNAEELDLVSKLYLGSQQEFIRLGPKGYVLYKKYLEFASGMANLELKDGDVFVMSYPRSGLTIELGTHLDLTSFVVEVNNQGIYRTTWCQELVWMIGNDLKYDQAALIPLRLRYHFLDFAMYFDDEAVELTLSNATDIEVSKQALVRFTTPGSEILQGVPSPRYVKTHMPLSLFPNKILDTAKVVYVARDPRDMAVSYYHFARMLRIMRFKGSFKDLWTAIRKDLCLRTPYFEHVKEAWAQRHHPNMLFLFYEELSNDLAGVVHRVANFLGKEMTPEQTQRLCDHLSFDSIKKNKSVNASLTSSTIGVLTPDEQFIRKGKVGGWREYFDEEMEREAQEWIEDNLRGTDLVYPSMEKDTV